MVSLKPLTVQPLDPICLQDEDPAGVNCCPILDATGGRAHYILVIVSLHRIPFLSSLVEMSYKIFEDISCKMLQDLEQYLIRSYNIL